MKKTTFEHIKCSARRYTFRGILFFGLLLNVLFFSTQYLLDGAINQPEIHFRLLILTIVFLAIVLSIYLYAVQFIHKDMTKPLRLLIDKIKDVDPQSDDKLVEIPGLHCDDELHDIIDAYNHKRQETQAYITHLKHVIGYIHHEFNTPLAAMMIRIHHLRKKHPEIKEPLNQMETNIDHLGKLIVALTDLMSVERYTPKEEEETSINEVVNSISKDAKLLYPDHHIKLEEKAHVKQQSCAEYIKLTIRNLVENAAKYSPKGSTITITINSTSISIKDQGKGINESDMKNIRLPFWQADKSRGKDQGYGMGLSLVRELSKRMGRTIDIESSTTGSTFTLYFDHAHAKTTPCRR